MLPVLLLLATQAPPPAPEATPAAPAPVEPAVEAPVKSEKCKIVVFNLVGRALGKGDEELPAILTEALASEIGPSSGCDVTSQADIVSMLDYEKQKAVCTDGSDSCLSEIGQAFGADRVIAGTVSKLASEYIVSAKLMNVKKGAVEQRAEQTVSSSSDLRLAAKNVGRRLFGAADLPSSTKATTIAAKADDKKPDANSGALWLWTGVVVGGVGLVAGATAGVLALVADAQLGDPKQQGKDAVQTAGLVELGVAGAGAVVAVAGGVVAAVSFGE